MNGRQKLAFISLIITTFPIVAFLNLKGGKSSKHESASVFAVLRLKYPGIDLLPLPFVFPLAFGICFFLNFAALIYLCLLEGKQKVFGPWYYAGSSVSGLALTGWVFSYSSEKLLLTFFLISTTGFANILLMIMAFKKAENLREKSSGLSAKWFDLIVVTGSECWGAYAIIYGNSLFLTASLMYEDGPFVGNGTLRGIFDQSTVCSIGIIPSVVMWSAWIVSDLALFHRYTRHSLVCYPCFVLFCFSVVGNHSFSTGLPFTVKIYLFMGVVSLVAWALRGNIFTNPKMIKSD